VTSKKTVALLSPKCRQVAALPWRRDKHGGLEVLLITSRTNSKWMLPKGWPMDGLSDADAAAQEAFEEAGVTGEVAHSPVGSYHFIKLFDDATTKPAQAIVFPLRVLANHTSWREKGQRRRKWFKPSKAAKIVFERELSRFLRQVAAGRVRLVS